MSTLHVSQPTLVIPEHAPERVAVIPKRPIRPQRTQISKVYQHASTDNNALNKPTPKLEPIDNAALQPDLLHQYNDMVGPDESLAFKRLPPVKVAYQSTKNKFIESPRVEGSSRIHRPHLSTKTYSHGRRIFTEGISKSSSARSPSFSLQQVGVPYSNLPDNISIYKEKDKYAFGVKTEEYEKSAYRLAPKPFKLGSASVIPSLEPDKHNTVSMDERFMKVKRGPPSNPGKPSFEMKSNVIKLEPIINKEEKDIKFGVNNKSDTDTASVPGGYARTMGSPLPRKNSFYSSDRIETRSDTTDVPPRETIPLEKLIKPNTQERMLSVVSIGETVGPSFYDEKKRETRQQYPMYDNTTRKNENYRRQKFEYADGDISHNKSHTIQNAAFTYKVSTKGMTFMYDNSVERFNPIRTNLHKQRGLSRYRMSSSDGDIASTSNDYTFRKYRKAFRRPKSSDSHSTDTSQLPGNPPPSEISHIFSEDVSLPINEIRNGMLTLVEERTLTASVVSLRKENTPIIEIGNDLRIQNLKEVENAGSKLTNTDDNDTCTDTDVQFENALRTIERYTEQEIESTRTEKGNVIEFERAVLAIEKTKELDSAMSANESSSKCDSSVVEKFIAEAEERIKTESVTDDNEKSVKQIEILNIDIVLDSKLTPTQDTKLGTIEENQRQNVKKKIKAIVKPVSNKQFLTVPTLSIDSINHHPTLPLVKERTSLSRKIQNMALPNEKRAQVAKQFQHTVLASEDGDANKAIEEKDNKSCLPVTRLRLFSDASTVSLNTPSVSLVDADGYQYDDIENDTLDESMKITFTEHQSISEKKAVNNLNIPFMYPLTTGVKAKRQ